MDQFIIDIELQIESCYLYSNDFTKMCVRRYADLYNIIYNELNIGGRTISNKENTSFFYNYNMLSVWADSYAKYELMLSASGTSPYEILLTRGNFALPPAAFSERRQNTLCYNLHFAMQGWTGPMPEGTIGGDIESRNCLEAVRIFIKDPSRVVYYQVKLDNKSWTLPEINGGLSGTTGQARRLSGIKIWLGDLALNYQVKYRAFTKGAWTEWHEDGEELLAPAGMTAFQAILEKRK